MSSDERSERLAADHQVMKELARQSSILEFDAVGTPPREYKVKLLGKGIRRGSSFGDDVEFGDEHVFEIRLGYSYPDYPPDVRCETPIFHPNVSSAGYARMDECGLQWEKDMTLDVVCERLWDIVRGAYVDLEHYSDFSARRWYEEQTKVSLPLDERPLRDRVTPSADNVVHYQRGPAGGKSASGDVLYIGDDAPPPPPPKKKRDDEDVLYIGDD